MSIYSYDWEKYWVWKAHNIEMMKKRVHKRHNVKHCNKNKNHCVHYYGSMFQGNPTKFQTQKPEMQSTP